MIQNTGKAIGHILGSIRMPKLGWGREYEMERIIFRELWRKFKFAGWCNIWRVQSKSIYRRRSTREKRGKIKTTILIIIYSLLFVFGLNYLLVVGTNYAVHSSPEKSTIPISKINFLSNTVFFIGSFIWLLAIVFGKRYSQIFISQYRLHFHIATYLIWFYLEVNLMFLTLTIASMTVIGTMLFWLLVLFLAYIIVHSRVVSLLELMYNEPLKKTKLDNGFSKLIGFIFKYGWSMPLRLLLMGIRGRRQQRWSAFWKAIVRALRRKWSFMMMGSNI